MTLSTCLSVLNFVHEAAVERDAGIIFLGDFWHHRGYVRVNCLNAVLDEMSRWTVPCVMIPGNHDQVDRTGIVHALSPLGNSYRIPSSRDGGGGGARATARTTAPGTTTHPGPLILTRPAKFLNALFVPHARDRQTLKSTLSAPAARACAGVFVHADVRGESTNDAHLSRRGIDVGECFPDDGGGGGGAVAVHYGHFHKPHVVTKRRRRKRRKGDDDGDDDGGEISVRYVGSPYQTSFAEAGQSKSLLVVDATLDWACVEEVPIDVGPRHFRFLTVDEFLTGCSQVDDVVRAGGEGGGERGEFRRGDRVSVTVRPRGIEEMRMRAAEDGAQGEGGKSPFDATLEGLRRAGVTVEIKDGQPPVEVTMARVQGDGEGDVPTLEELSPEANLEAYISHEIEEGELGEDTAKMLLEKGGEIIREVCALDANSNNLSSRKREAVAELELDSISVAGYGTVSSAGKPRTRCEIAASCCFVAPTRILARIGKKLKIFIPIQYRSRPLGST